ncbi:MAG TPA: SDR family oxidoreductase [Solirubrobacteraceae bacterium]|nr:SDR family oxidoreductase [Solirubrobacteraceae bacterium]
MPHASTPDVPDGAVLLTGVTGFVGMEVLARYLERSARHVVALVRAEDDAHAEARLRATIDAACGDADAHAGRVTAIAGDLTAPRLGLGRRWEALAARVGAIVHGAASVAFDLPLRESRVINVEGTRRMLDFARACPQLERFTYVSTAYVAGDRRGTVYEDDVEPGPFRNAYERSKHEAEQLVAAARDEMDTTIVRPSIVVGDHRTGWTAAFNVLYAPLRAFAAGVIPVVPARRRSPVDVVPVDYVADAVHALAQAPEATGQTFHVVAGAQATTVGEIVALAEGRFATPTPRLLPPRVYRAVGAAIVARRAPSSARRLLASTEPYFPYFAMRLRFDDARARAVLEPRGISPAPLSAYFDRLIDYAVAARWGRQEIGRAAARKLAAT